MTTAPLTISDIQLEHFSTVSRHQDRAIFVQMRGNADMQAQEVLDGLLQQLDADAKRLAVSETVVDVAELYFMNSSCLSLLMRWITSLMQETTAHRYTVRFKAHPTLRWQKRSLMALVTLAKGVVVIE